MGIRTIHPIIGTAAELAAANYRLYDNQTALESDTGLTKIGDGLTAYADLAYTPQAAQNNAQVRVATTANITIATALNNADTLDGIALVTGDLVLVKNQTAAEGNGIYVVGATPARATNFNTYNEHPGSIVTVAEGTANAERVLLCTSNAGGTLDTTAITYSDFGLVVGASHTATATAAGSTTLTVASNEIQEFTGSTTQTIVLPVVTTLPRTGWQYHIFNNSTGALTVNSSGANLVQTIPAGGEAIITCILLTGTTAASWRTTLIPVTSSAGALQGTQTFTGLISMAPGTTALAPYNTPAGTVKTTPAVGDTEFDGAATYRTNEATAGRGAVFVDQRFRLAAAGSTISTIANFFGANSNPVLVSGAHYEIDIYAWFLKSTAGTVVWTLTNSAAPTAQDIEYEMSPVTGIVAPPGTATVLLGHVYNDATAALALSATAELSDAVNHYMHMKIYLINSTGTSLKIQATVSAGTITPGIGSRWSCRRVPVASTGLFAA